MKPRAPTARLMAGATVAAAVALPLLARPCDAFAFVARPPSATAAGNTMVLFSGRAEAGKGRPSCRNNRLGGNGGGAAMTSLSPSSSSSCMAVPPQAARSFRCERLATLGRVRWNAMVKVNPERAIAGDSRSAPGGDGVGAGVRSSSSGSSSMSAFVLGGSLGREAHGDTHAGAAGGGGVGSGVWGGAAVVGPARIAPQHAAVVGVEGVSMGVGSGLRRARRALGSVFQRRGSPVNGQKASKAAAAAAGFSRASAWQTPEGGGTAPPPPAEGAQIDIDDVLRQTRLLLRDDNEPDRNKRVLILMSDTGGGHRASAQALKAAFDDLYPGAIDVDIVDMWTTHAPWPLNKFVEAYQFMAKRPFIWKAFWEYGRFPLTRRITDEMTNFQCHRRFRSMIEEYEPDLVVSVHPLCQEVPMRVMKKMGGGERRIPFVTVVTDLGGAHPTWFHREVDACFVPSNQLALAARKCGLDPGQIRLHGLPIRSGFWGEQSAKEELQQKLGLKPGVKACLVVGGGDGVGGLKGIADSVGQKLGQGSAEAQVVVVCGTNDGVKTSLEKGNWASNVHVHVKGFVSNMDEWMGAVDCIVTKAGPGTIAEAMIRGLPIMLSAFLPGQEAGNVPYVTEGGFGSFSKDPAKIADTISTWLRDDELLAKMSSKAKEASRPQATYKICEDIGEMLFGKGNEPVSRIPANALSVVA